MDVGGCCMSFNSSDNILSLNKEHYSLLGKTQAGKGTVSTGYCTVYSLKVGTETMGIKSGQNVLWGPTLSLFTILNRGLIKKSPPLCKGLSNGNLQYSMRSWARMYCLQCFCAIARVANSTKVQCLPCCSLIYMHISPMWGLHLMKSWLLSCLHAKRLTNNEKTNQSRCMASFTCKI